MLVKLAASLCVAGLATTAVFVTFALCGEVPPEGANKPIDDTSAAKPTEDDPRVPVAVARERAELMHRIYAATLEVLHHRYFHNTRAMVPARAMEDIFDEMARQSQIEAKWSAVNLRAMSLSHEPKSEFEKAAAREIGDGKEYYELVEDGYYRRAGAIPMASGCVNCHSGFFKEPPKTPRFAALVISVPVKDKENANAKTP